MLKIEPLEYLELNAGGFSHPMDVERKVREIIEKLNLLIAMVNGEDWLDNG